MDIKFDQVSIDPDIYSINVQNSDMSLTPVYKGPLLSFPKVDGNLIRIEGMPNMPNTYEVGQDSNTCRPFFGIKDIRVLRIIPSNNTLEIVRLPLPPGLNISDLSKLNVSEVEHLPDYYVISISDALEKVALTYIAKKEEKLILNIDKKFRKTSNYALYENAIFVDNNTKIIPDFAEAQDRTAKSFVTNLKKINSSVAGMLSGMNRADSELFSIKMLPDLVQNWIAEGQRVKQILKDIKRVYFGQDGVVEIIKNIEWSDISTGGMRLRPEIIWVYGSPGTGKDTGAYAWTIAKARHLKDSAGNPLYNSDSAIIEDHVKELPVVKSDADLWEITGAARGHVGSQGLTDFHKWVIKHSGGRYIIKKEMQNDKEVEYAAINKAWRPGMVLPDYFSPSMGVVFVNELHDWKRHQVNTLLKQMLINGTIPISGSFTATDSVSNLKVPLTFWIASNDHLSKIEGRDHFGQFILGKILSPEAQQEKVNLLNGNPKEALADLVTGTESLIGYSAEFINRIPLSRFICTNVWTDEGLKRIANFNLKVLAEQLGFSRLNEFPKIILKWSDRILDYMVKTVRRNELGARAISDIIDNQIKPSLLAAVLDPLSLNRKAAQKWERKQEIANGSRGEFSNRPLADNSVASLDVTDNPNGTATFFVNQVPYFSKATLSRIKPVGLDSKRLRELTEIQRKMNSLARGQEEIIANLINDIKNSENENQGEARARAYGFLGTSRGGKTLIGQVLHRELFKTDTDPWTPNFGTIKNTHTFKEMFIEKLNSKGEKIPTDFENYFTIYNGKFVIILDEFTNTDPEVQTMFYDLLDKFSVSGTNGRKMSMANVIFIINGNLGEKEWTRGIDETLPEEQRWAAQREIYEEKMATPKWKRQFLRKSGWNDAFINRIHERRIFFFGPQTFKTVREVIHTRLNDEIKKLNNPQGKSIKYNLRFASEEDYLNTIKDIETVGYDLDEQVASINDYISDQLIGSIKLAISNVVEKNMNFSLDLPLNILLVKPPDQVITTLKSPEDARRIGEKVLKSKYYVLIQNQSEPLEISIQMPTKAKKKQRDYRNDIVTSFHEAGHEIVRKVLFMGETVSEGITRIPGVAVVNGEAVRYLGYANSSRDTDPFQDRSYVIKELAVLTAGRTAEEIILEGNNFSAGAGDDNKRAFEMAQRAILYAQLTRDPVLQNIALTGDKPMHELIEGLSPKVRKALDKEVNEMIVEARELGRQVILLNFKQAVIPVALELAREAIVKKEFFDKFYKKNIKQILDPRDLDESNIEKLLSWTAEGLKSSQNIKNKVKAGIQFKENILSIHGFEFPTERKVLDSDIVVAEMRQNKINQVLDKVPEELLAKTLMNFRSLIVKARVPYLLKSLAQSAAGLRSLLVQSKPIRCDRIF